MSSLHFTRRVYYLRLSIIGMNLILILTLFLSVQISLNHTKTVVHSYNDKTSIEKKDLKYNERTRFLLSYRSSINEAILKTRTRMKDTIVNQMPYVHGYKNVWARDTLFSCYGFIADEQYDVARNLLYYLWNGRYTSANGDSISVITNTTNPRDGEDECIDSTPLWIIIADEYLRVTDDKEFKKFLRDQECYEKLMKWMDGRIDEGLVSQYGSDRYYLDWSDSARKDLAPKHVMYSNILFWKAYSIVASDKAEKLKENIENNFWNGMYYRDFVGGEYLSADGNLLAIIWDFATREQSIKILESMEDMIFPMPTVTVKPKYYHDPDNYQNGRVWGWLGSLSIIAYTKVGDFTNANMAFRALSTLLEHERWRFSELYTDQGSKAGAPFFVWFTGLFMYALYHLNIGETVPTFSHHNIMIFSSLVIIIGLCLNKITRVHLRMKH